MTHPLSARVWPTGPANGPYPEQAHPSVPAPLRTGVCFSGGSTRSFAATLGQLRGLTESGLLSAVGYISAVSGGAWAAVPYTYYAGDGESDRALLGRHVEPEHLSVDELDRLEPQGIGAAATGNFGRALARVQGISGITPDGVWTHAVGEMFLRPFGLFDPVHPVGFTLSEATAEDIYRRNPPLRDRPLRTVWSRSYRPYLLVHSTLNWPPDRPDRWAGNGVGFEYAPLGVGAPSRHTFDSGGKPVTLGGGFIEPFAFGGGPPGGGSASTDVVEVAPPARVFSLADMVGASSAFSAPDRDLRSYPQMDGWSVGGGAERSTLATRHVFSDGGDLENYGLIPLLARGVRTAVVFINSLWPLALDYDPRAWPDDLDLESPGRRCLDPFLAPLFGAPSTRFAHNRVFREADYPDVVAGLQSAKRRGETVMTVSTHTVEPNEWWGLGGGDPVTVCWVYNDRVDRWTARLPVEVRALVEAGQADVPTGPFARVPHYLTRGQNEGALIQLTAPQINLLAHLSSWNVVDNRDTLRSILE